MTSRVYSAPKLENALQDFLKTDESKYDVYSKMILDDSSSSDDYLSNEPIENDLRSISEKEEQETGFEGYIFDENLCKLINERILCGYERNKGEIDEEDKSMAIGNNCFIRGDRIECGYLQKPLSKSVHLRVKAITDTEGTINKLLYVNGTTKKQEEMDIPGKPNTKNLINELPNASSARTQEEGYISQKSKTESSINELPNVSDSTKKEGDTNIPEKPNTITKLPIQLSVSNTSKLKILELKTTAKKPPKETSTYTQHLKIVSDSILSTKLLPEVLTNNIPTLTTIKKSDMTLLSSSIFTNSVKNVTINNTEIPSQRPMIGGLDNKIDIRNSDETKNSKKGMLLKLKTTVNNSKEIHHEKPLTEPAPSLKNLKFSIEVSHIKPTSTTSLPTKKVKPKRHLKKDKSKLKSLRKSSDKTKIQTACVENKDRIVCFDYTLA